MSRSLEFFAKQSSWLAALSALHAKNNAFVWLEDACDPSETPGTVVKPWLQAKPPNPVNKWRGGGGGGDDGCRPERRRRRRRRAAWWRSLPQNHSVPLSS